MQPPDETRLSGQTRSPAEPAGSSPRPDPHAASGEPVVTQEQASIYLQSMYPGVSARVRRKILKRFARSVRRGWVGRVVGIVVHNFCRHRRTEYETLLDRRRKQRTSRDEARKIVAAKLEAIVQGFQAGSAENDAGYSQIRSAFRARRMVEGKLPAITADENEAITGYLTGWLRHRLAEQQARSAGPIKTLATQDEPIDLAVDHPQE